MVKKKAVYRKKTVRKTKAKRTAPKMGVYGKYKQKGGKVKSIKADKARLAKAPGWRQSKSGKVYWEARVNRSDGNKKARY